MASLADKIQESSVACHGATHGVSHKIPRDLTSKGLGFRGLKGLGFRVLFGAFLFNPESRFPRQENLVIHVQRCGAPWLGMQGNDVSDPKTKHGMSWPVSVIDVPSS